MKFGIWYRCPAYDFVDENDKPGWILDDADKPIIFLTLSEARQYIDKMHNPLKWEWYEPREYAEVERIKRNKVEPA